MEDIKINNCKKDNSSDLGEETDFMETITPNNYVTKDQKVETGICSTRKISRKLLRTPKCARF